MPARVYDLGAEAKLRRRGREGGGWGNGTTVEETTNYFSRAREYGLDDVSEKERGGPCGGPC